MREREGLAALKLANGNLQMSTLISNSDEFERIDLGEGEIDFWGGENGPDRCLLTEPWDVLVADDESDAREAARIALEGVELQGRPMRLHFADSAKAALSKLEAVPAMAVILLDVVMETQTAGLDLVKEIRSRSEWDSLRIILRTGQPGYAPELLVAREYDINDYKAKSELTQAKLVASLASSLRAYAQIDALKWQTERLKNLARAAGAMVEAGLDPLEAAAHAVLAARGALGNCEVALATRESGHDWLVACKGFAPELDDGTLDVTQEGLEGVDLPDFAMLGERQRRSAESLSAALGAGLTRGEEVRGLEGGVARIVRSGQDPVAIWWRPLDEKIHQGRRNLFEAFCASVSAALEAAVRGAQARRAAYWDELTNLPNRSWLMERIDQYGAAEKEGKSVMFVDLMGFSSVNDALGYDAGDAMLVEAAQVLANAYPKCSIARLPGGSFAAIGESADMDEERAYQAFESPIKAAGWEMPMKVQLGRANLMGRKDARHSLNEANMALNAVKASASAGMACKDYDEELERGARERHKVAKDLKKALRGLGGLSLFYQPQISMASGKAEGVEALARWVMPDGTMIPPSRFVQIAESCGLVVELGDWALAEACRQAKAWRSCGFDMPIAVNVSPLQIENAGVFLDKLAERLDKAECEPSWIELEITEAAAMKDEGQVRAAIEEARKWGCKASLDDFGTGFSSLSRLAGWPLDKLKMDRSLVIPLSEDAKARAVVKMIHGLGLELGLRVVAEGVETEGQREALMGFGVDLAQGWLYCKALPESELIIACARGF